MSDGLWADSLPVEFYSEAEDLGRRNTVATLILEGTLPDDEINNFYRQKFGTASPDDVALWNEDMIYFIKHQSKELIKQKSQEKKEQVDSKEQFEKKEEIGMQDRSAKISSRNETIYKKDNFFKLNDNFVNKMNEEDTSFPVLPIDESIELTLVSVDELIKLKELARSHQNPKDIEHIAKLNEPLYQRYRLVLLDMLRDFDFDNLMNNEESTTLKNILNEVLHDDGILKKENNNFVVNTETLDNIETNFPFSFAYQTLRMNLNKIADRNRGMKGVNLDPLYEALDNVSGQDKSEIEKLEIMNATVSKFYLGFEEKALTHPIIKALKDYITKLPSKPLTAPINDSSEAYTLYDNIYSKLTAPSFTTNRNPEKNELLQKIADIMNSDNSDVVKYAKLRIALRDTIEKVESTMWGKPSLFGSGSRLRAALLKLEENEIKKQNQPEAKSAPPPAQHGKKSKR